MADEVRITFTADISDLRRGLEEASAGVAQTTAVLKAGADAVGLSYAALTRAYAAGAQQRLDLVRTGSDDELAIARAGDRAQTEVALDAVKLKQNQVREDAQIGAIGRDEERSQLLALEGEREGIERAHLAFLQSTYADNARAFANTQRQIDELAAQSALRRQLVERSYLREVDADYRRTFEQVGSSVAQGLTGMIRGHEQLRQAVGNVLLAIVERFIQARVRAVADWAAGVAAQTAATTAGETSKTAAVAAGSAARQSMQAGAATAGLATTFTGVAQSIAASAAETFAGIFGFLAPVMGPAAAGPAAAGQATVAAVAGAIPAFAAGAWSLPSDTVAHVHAGEMIVPAGPAALMRAAAGSAPGGGRSGGETHSHAHFHVTAMDSRDVRRFFSDHSKHILGAISDGLRSGSHLGFGRLRNALGG